MSSQIQQLITAGYRPRLASLRVASAVKNAETVTIGGVTFEARFTGTGQTAGNVVIDLSAAASLAAATLTGTFSGTGTANDTIVLAGQTYTLKGTLTGAANEVLIGADAAATRNNFVAAVNAAAGAGTTYGTGTIANASFSAAASSTADVVITARAKGTPGNALVVAETGTGFSFAGAATSPTGGTDASAADFTTALTAIINSTAAQVRAERVSANEVVIVENGGVVQALATTETLTGSNNGWAGATTYGGRGLPSNVVQSCLFPRVPTATEVALGVMHSYLPFAPAVANAQILTTSTGARRTWDGTVTIVGNRVTLAAGTTPIATTETAIIHASE